MHQITLQLLQGEVPPPCMPVDAHAPEIRRRLMPFYCLRASAVYQSYF